MRKVLDVFAYSRELVNDELAQVRYEGSIQPGFQESFSSMFPAPRQRWVEAMCTPEEDIRALPHRTLILHGREDQVIPLQTSLRLDRAHRQCRSVRLFALRTLVDDRTQRRLQPQPARVPLEVTAGETMATSTESKPQSAGDAVSCETAGRDPAVLVRIYEMMVLTRAVEDRMVAMYKTGDLLGSLYTGHWHEAISVAAAAALRDGDYMAPIHRDLGAHLVRGMEPWQVMASFMGKATSPTGGRDGTLHYGRLDLGIYNLPSHIPANFPVATGMAFAAKYRGEDRVCLAFCGDGSTSRADFHEALNMAGALTLPCVFVIENNQFAYSTPVSMQTASTDFAAKAVAYGFPGVKVDGTDALAVYDAVSAAVERARGGRGTDRWSKP